MSEVDWPTDLDGIGDAIVSDLERELLPTCRAYREAIFGALAEAFTEPAPAAGEGT